MEACANVTARDEALQMLYIARGRHCRKVDMKRTDADDDCVCVESGESNPKVKLIHRFLVSWIDYYCLSSIFIFTWAYSGWPTIERPGPPPSSHSYFVLPFSSEDGLL